MTHGKTLILVLTAAIVLGCPEEDTVLDPADDDVGDDDATADDDTDGPADADGDGWTVDDGDCDDGNADVYPGAPEICDGLDNDCDGTTNDCVFEGDFDVDDADTVLLGMAEEDSAGSEVAVVEDLDGEGHPDLLVLASWADQGWQDAGSLYVVSGPPAPGTYGLDSSHARIGGLDGYGHLEFLSSLGDLDDDGAGDFLVASTGGPSGGAEVYLFYGPVPAGDSTVADAYTTWTAEHVLDDAFRVQTGNGDLDGDGHDDFVIGAGGEETNGQSAGAAYVIHGPPPEGTHSMSTADSKLLGIAENDQAGLDVAIAGDLDGDGLDDLVLTSKDNTAAGDRGGALHIVYGPVTPGEFGLDLDDVTIWGPHTTFFSALRPVGDPDGDGLDDLVICLEWGDDCWLVSGATQADADIEDVAVTTFTTDQPGHRLECRGVGDMNADGVVDYLFVELEHDDPDPYAGATRLLYGPVQGLVDMDDADAIVVGTYGGQLAINSVLGDLDGDGGDDLIIGAQDDSQAAWRAGAVYFFPGNGQ